MPTRIRTVHRKVRSRYGLFWKVSERTIFTEVFDALANLEFPHIYPDPESRRLREKLVSTFIFYEWCWINTFSKVFRMRCALWKYYSWLWSRWGDTTNINIFLKCECVTKLIYLIFRVVLEPGDCIINTPPTFGMYAFDCCVNGAYF